jgi:predicted enzyme related to lactoylglutathione lyase
MTELKPGAVLFAVDMVRVAAFYEGLLGMRRVEQVPTAIVLQAGGFELIVHAIPAQIATEIIIDDPPRRREESAHKLVFPVADLAVARERAAARGGLLDPAGTEWSWGGFRACDGHDPEGNCFQLRVPARSEGLG